MNKLFKISGAVAVIAGVMTVSTATFAQETAPQSDDRPSIAQRVQDGIRNGLRNRGGGFGDLNIDKGTIMAEALGISVEELEAAKADGTNKRELIEQLGLDAETVKANVQTAMIAQIQAGVESGTITQEQADQMIERVERVENGKKGFGKRGHRGGKHRGGKRGVNPEVMAQALGISVEELEAAKAEGTKLNELIEQLGLDQETVKANLQAAKIAQIQAKVEDGSITQEQADRMIERIESGERGRHGGRNGGRNGGQRGGPQGDDA